MPNREPDPRFESEYHPRMTDRANSERAEWNSLDGDGAQVSRSQQYDSDDRSSWYERNNRRNQVHRQHPVDHRRSAEQYREDFGHPGYGERYGFSGYGRSHYDPDINRGYMESPEVESWREGARFTDREQDYRGGRWNHETHGYHNGDGRFHNGDGRGGFAGIAPKNYQRSDARIEEDICEQLTMNPYIDPSNIEIKVMQSEVTLTGNVADRRMKRLAEDIAEETPGVRNVINQIHTGVMMTNERFS
jgi:hypothetical protein